MSYLLSELGRWEADGLISQEQATALRQSYERRRDQLRALLTSDVTRAKSFTPERNAQQPAEATETASRPATLASSERRPASTSLSPGRTLSTRTPRRPLVETLTDPHTLRLLLYAGALMFTVGIIIWLRDVLYLKLQEPAVQAALLALGTLAITASGWYAILRTRQRLTGRALTLTGSLLVPVNFWFLVRSGLIANNGRAWVVCAFCTMLYAQMAALLREKLYVYLACSASVATLWALVYRAEREAFGLYALALMAASLVFLHLSRLFPVRQDANQETGGISHAKNTEERTGEPSTSDTARWSYEVWAVPLVHGALLGATLCALAYMPLRLWPSPSLYDGVFRLRANTYDSSVAMLLFAAGAYVMWFTGRYVYPDRRILLYTISVLALFWTEFLAGDGLRLSDPVQILALTLMVLAVSVLMRRVQDDALARALNRASLGASLVLAPASFYLLLNAPAVALTHSMAFAALAATLAVLSAPRFSDRAAQAALAHASAVFASAAFLIALASAHLRSETLFAAACAAWPFVLYASAWLAQKRRREAHLVTPFVRIADVGFVLLLLWASVTVLFLHLTYLELHDYSTIEPRRVLPSVFCLLSASILYGALRALRDRSVFGAILVSVAAIVLVASSLDALKIFGLLPVAWPVAAGVICAAFLMQKASARWLRTENGPASAVYRSQDSAIRFVSDSAAGVCALVWLAVALNSIGTGSFGAVSVLLLTLLYWAERAARINLQWVAYLALTHTGALLLALLIALRVDVRWFALCFTLLLFPLFFALGRLALARGADWLAIPAGAAAGVVAALAFIAALFQAMPYLQAGNPLLLAPCLTTSAVVLMSFAASVWATGRLRVRYFRAGLYLAVISFALACLRAGYEPTTDTEVYTSPVAVVMLIIAYASVQRDWNEYAHDVTQLLWTGSLLLCAPLFVHALHFRLVLDVPAPWRDLGVLVASLALVLFGSVGRLRAPVLVGAATLAAELTVLALTSVDWLQVPLKYYLITVGALFLFVFGMIEYRRDQLLLMRQRFHERREYMRERFGEWR